MIPETADPLDLFNRWMADAERGEPNDPAAVSLATATAEGKPSVRMVLLKFWDAERFVFFSNRESRKGQELMANPHAALCIYWKSLKRQVRIEGPVTLVPEAEADAYFASRHPQRRIATWASRQSRPLTSRQEFLTRIQEYEKKYPGEDIPRPPYWVGFAVEPQRIEFWAEEPHRTHDRVLFTRHKDGWITGRLYP